MRETTSKANLLEGLANSTASLHQEDASEKPLGAIEKQFLLYAERGDCAAIRRLVQQYGQDADVFDINCVDPLNRSALVAAIENENMELIRLLLEFGIKVKVNLWFLLKRSGCKNFKFRTPFYMQSKRSMWKLLSCCCLGRNRYTNQESLTYIENTQNLQVINKLFLELGSR